MATSDGSIIISVDMDVDEADKELGKLKKKIHSTEQDIERLEKKKAEAEKQSVLSAAELDAEKAKLAELKNTLEEIKATARDTSLRESVRAEAKAQLPVARSEISEQAERVRILQGEYNKLDNAVLSYNQKLIDSKNRLDQQKADAGELAQRINSVSVASQQMAEAQKRAEKSMQRFGMRLSSVVRSALVFTVITQALSALRNWIGKVIRANTDASKAVARLKGALLTLAQPLVQVIIPAFVKLVDILTRLVYAAANVVSFIFGTTAEESAKAAEALNGEIDALEGTGDAAKKAGKSLAAFDEINKLTSSEAAGSSVTETIEPDFELSGMESGLAKILSLVNLIGAALMTWRIAPALKLSLKGALFLFAAIEGGIILVESLFDALINGVGWDNLAGMLGGLALLAFGLYKALGMTAAAVSLVIGGIAILVTGFKDVIENGGNLKNTLIVIAGIMATGLGISLLTGSLLPLLVAGIASVIYALVAWQGNAQELVQNLKLIFTGIVDFIAGVFTGDWERAWNGIYDVYRGIVNSVIILFESMVNGIISGMNWLIRKLNTLSWDMPDGMGGLLRVGFNIPEIDHIAIPRLATGAVIPPNREFMAVLGDQKSGNNIEAPESLIRRIVREETAGGNGDVTVILEMDKVQFGKAVFKLNKEESRRIGTRLVTT